MLRGFILLGLSHALCTVRPFVFQPTLHHSPDGSIVFTCLYFFNTVDLIAKSLAA